VRAKTTGAMTWVVLVVFLMVQVYPIFWIFTSSLKTTIEFREKSPFSLPSSLNFANYVEVLTNSNILKYFINSMYVTAVSIVCIVLLSCMAGFALQKFRFKISKWLLILFLSGLMIPIQVTLIPLFQIYLSVGFLDTYWSVILPQIGFGLPISIYLFATFFEYLPNEILEASIIDGCNIYTAFMRIAVPSSMNAAMTVVILNAIFIWNEFVFANTFLSRDVLKTLPLGLMDFISERGQTNWGMTFAAIAISTLPLMLIYFAMNKRIMEGATAGAVKN
jgi:raffinose/stachyose/melibiose transport system permease protein